MVSEPRRVEDVIHLEFVQEPKPEGEITNAGYLTQSRS